MNYLICLVYHRLLSLLSVVKLPRWQNLFEKIFLGRETPMKGFFKTSARCVCFEKPETQAYALSSLSVYVM